MDLRTLYGYIKFYQFFQVRGGIPKNFPGKGEGGNTKISKLRRLLCHQATTKIQGGVGTPSKLWPEKGSGSAIKVSDLMTQPKIIIFIQCTKNNHLNIILSYLYIRNQKVGPRFGPP